MRENKPNRATQQRTASGRGRSSAPAPKQSPFKTPAPHSNNHGRTAYGIVITAVIIAVVVVFNVLLYGLATENSWYFYASDPIAHSIGHGTDDYVKEVSDRGSVRIIFCDTEENLEKEPVFNLVWQTAQQFAERHDFVTVAEPINIFKDPQLVEKYKYDVDDEGNREQINTINRYSVIVEGVETKDFVVLPMHSFFILDQDQVIISYTGEEVMAAMIHRVQTPEVRPVAYFTINHGETYSVSFMNRLVCAGYDIKTVDLISEDLLEMDIDPKGDLLVISNPQYDFTRGNAASGAVGELDRIDAFLAKGGNVFTMLDPIVTNTVKLEAFLSSWGMTITRTEKTNAHGIVERDAVMVRDDTNSITTDGYALVAEICREGVGADIGAAMDKHDAGRIIISRASPITLKKTEGKEVTPLLRSSSSSASYAGGNRVNNNGNYPIAAISRDEATGGSVFVVGSVYMTAEDALTTNEYGNRDLVFHIVGVMSDISVPAGGTHLLFDNRGVEDLTMWEARLWTVIVAVLVPLSVAVTGTVVIIKRRNR